MTDTKELTFEELIVRAKSGDNDAFGKLYEMYLTPVYRYVYIRLGNREEADDITQETFLRAYRAKERFEVTTDNFLPYLFTIARNLLINKAKKKKPELMKSEDMERQDGGMRADTEAIEREGGEVLERALATLTEIERTIIELRFFGERTYAEIATICDKREDSVRQHVARALKKMRMHVFPKK